MHVRVLSMNRLPRLAISAIEQCACSGYSRSSWRFWIAHYSRKRFDRFTRMLTGGILNIAAGAGRYRSVREGIDGGQAQGRARSQDCGGKSYAERDPELVSLARQLYRPDPNRRPVSLRQVSAALAQV